ncbi:MAG TPA: site-2 protease family protein [Opitutaceae bacterium]
MLASIDTAVLTAGLIQFLILLASLCVHEWAHAWTASRLGDPTARMAGRVTFNPMAHIDPIGTIAIPLFMVFVSASSGGGFGIIGWAKPVPVDARYFRKPVRDDLLVTMAGPFSNIVLCLLAALIGGLALRFVPDAQVVESFGLVRQVIQINALLAVFNMLPVPPLDGSHLLRHAVRMKIETYIAFSRWGFLILIVLINIPVFRMAMYVAIVTVAQPFAILAAMLAR